ncbi:MAG: secondary thiamine-phosphate synthase enzyme YjbQ [Verrucomicrobiota bacterium]|nr:secondary thiamine-phosphate synthase enzyme YjbQ [Verrucomicrobiota bacterium]
MIELKLRTTSHTQFLEITSLVQTEINRAGIKAGSATVFVPHTTAGIMIQENADPDVMRDMEYALEKMIPWKDHNYRHGEGNTAAHVKAACLGSSAHVFIEDGQIQFGTWQGIYLCEFDGPRSRNVWVKLQKD